MPIIRRIATLLLVCMLVWIVVVGVRSVLWRHQLNAHRDRQPPPYRLSPPSHAYIEESNVARSRIGLRRISPSWFFYGSRDGEEYWKLNDDQNEPDCKVVGRTGDRVVWEADYYYGRTFEEDGGVLPERLTVRYNYVTRRIEVYYRGEDPLIEMLVSPLAPRPPAYELGTTNIVAALSIVSEILTRWGLTNAVERASQGPTTDNPNN